MTASAIAQILMVATLLLMITGKTPIYITAICGATISALVAGFPITGKEGMTIAKMVSSGLNPVIADMTGILLFIGIMQATGFMDVIIRDIVRVGNKLGGGTGVCTAGGIAAGVIGALTGFSFFLDLLHKSEKPIVCTAAMRGAGDTSPDGPMNILCSVKAAASKECIGMGVLVCLNETLHAPGEVMKTHSANPATFQSPWWGPVGYVDLDKIVFRRKPLGVKRFAPKALTARVDVIKCMTGSTRDYIDFAVSQGCKGIVIEGFGRGNVPPPMVPGIEDAVKKGVAVVLTTRTPGGRVLDVYGYPGSVTDTRRAGLAMGGELSAAKARLKLMIVLSEKPELAKDRDALEALFDI